MTREEQRISLAYHEAGHAVVAYKLGYKPTLVTIRKSSDSDGMVKHRAFRSHGWCRKKNKPSSDGTGARSSS
jgi:ATP-dependent Zn protease